MKMHFRFKNMPLTTVTRPWSAIRVTPYFLYSGANTIARDNLLTSVSNNRGGENPFLVEHRTLEGSWGSNKEPAGNFRFVQSGQSSALGSKTPQYVAFNPPSDAEIWARTNPSRPAILLPVALFELREVPDMIRQAGRFLLHAKNWKDYIRSSSQDRDIATANLAFQFGWAPLIGDLYKIATFQDMVNKRRKQIDGLYKGKGLRKRIHFGEVSGSWPDTTILCGFGSFWTPYAPMKWSGTAECWAVVKWKPTSPSALPPSDGELRRLLLGLHPSNILENVWEALPWSWLVDYFTNVGNIISAGNHYLATPSKGCVMTRQVTRMTHEPIDSTSLRVSAGTITCVRKTRVVMSGSASVTARLPTLATGQLSILGSLAVLRARNPKT